MGKRLYFAIIIGVTLGLLNGLNNSDSNAVSGTEITGAVTSQTGNCESRENKFICLSDQRNTTA